MNEQQRTHHQSSSNEDDVFGRSSDHNVAAVSSLVSPSDITIPQLVENVNTKTGDILRYIPDSLLSQAQIEQKRQSQIADNNKICSYAQDEQYAERAGKLVSEQAELKGYVLQTECCKELYGQ